jgi:hypothetical protein
VHDRIRQLPSLRVNPVTALVSAFANCKSNVPPSVLDWVAAALLVLLALLVLSMPLMLLMLVMPPSQAASSTPITRSWT